MHPMAFGEKNEDNPRYHEGTAGPHTEEVLAAMKADITQLGEKTT